MEGPRAEGVGNPANRLPTAHGAATARAAARAQLATRFRVPLPGSYAENA